MPFSHTRPMIRRNPMPWCLLLMGLLLLLPAASGAQSAPAVRPRVEVTGSAVRVSDLFAGPLPAALKRHGDTTVFNAPMPGKERFVPGAFLARKLSLLAGAKALEITAPNRVCLVRKGQRLSDKRLLPFLEAMARTIWKGSVAVSELRVTGRRTLPLGSLALTPDTKRARVRKNRIELPVAVSVNGTSMGRLTLSGEAHIMKNVVVASVSIPKGETLSADQITLASRPVSPSGTDILTDPALAVGREATRPIASGTELTSRLVKAPPLVKRGDGVRIRYTQGGLLITATGIARETGGLGDFIKVKNSRSGKGITCRVIGQCRVEPFL
ncbi:flagellar basal body P-ring formation chaperone FlgA [Desulfoluna spongiiphila]|uniref:flagellar basal body P-ring formation chaperone FlgA n=1 Tax=Desulfoluna spongiiphila TaxID=419481 RepID=UPI001869E301|nr:flagellar basal body P-ring formation chaperone FlgA [Desulfoluna spongiiphila]